MKSVLVLVLVTAFYVGVEGRDVGKSRRQPPPKQKFISKPADYQWVSWAANSKIPQRAISAGDNWNQSSELYVARVHYKGADYVAKASVKDHKCYLAYEASVICYDRCEVLTGSGFSWVEFILYAADDLPANAFVCGTKTNGHPQLIGRVDHVWQGVLLGKSLGTIDTDYRLLEISFDGRVYQHDRYDVLVVD